MSIILPLSSSKFPANFKSIPSPKSTPQLILLQSNHSFFISRRIPSIYRFRSSKNPPISAVSQDVDTFTKYSGYIFDENNDNSEAEIILEYNPSKISSIYRKKPLLLLRRLLQVGNTLGRWFILRYVDKVTQRSDSMFKVRAAELRKILVELGPAFVKIAQAVSSRADVIPPAYLDELSLLQDRITPFSSEVAFGTMEKELGLPIERLFSAISPETIAAASLGQVYKAKLRQSGQVVAVKVQRPGVQAAITLDIFILRFLAGLVRTVGKFNTDLPALVDEWASSLFRELDYREEAKNGVKFRQLYGSLKDVFVPNMYVEQTSRRVLVMEWVEGRRLSEVKDLYLIEVGVYCSLSQLLEYGFYHADPHPGNLLRTYDGKLAYLDFGMMGEFRQELRDGFIEACLHLVNRDFNALGKDFVTLGLLPATAQKDEVTKALTGVFENAVNRGVRNISFGDLSGNLGRTMYKFKFQIPSYFSLVIRSLAVLEGIAVSFNPNYKVLSSSYPWIARKVLTDSSPQLRSSLQALLYEDGVFRIDRLESLLTESLRAKTENALTGGGGEDTDSRVVIKQVLSFTLTEKGEFVRETLLQELAKGLDSLGLAALQSVTSAAASRLPFASPFLSISLSNEDIIDLRNLRQLVQLLSRFQKNQNQSMGAEDASTYMNQRTSSEEGLLVLNQLEYAQELLPILSILLELPQESQQRMLLLPADLAGRLASRLTARTIQRFLI
ncbi:hypothetical protein C5167_014136 [Papaver somniferum]|uniref:Protein kinase domain-containing protein n=1 Tax=Papaver somniferum TaxID=3469 RepID=A0A4Y7J5F5_PAPSO|nr:uncharacterized aarF domain-containing protein kinase At1g71810, chloroplastic-like isoform X1 [Papaver somniferum]RZC55290.1 hypothetical protein C5167_014136 [Papaver somniferum]